MVGVIAKPDKVDPFDGWYVPEPSGDFGGVCGLDPVARFEVFKPEGLHVGYVRSHVGSEVHQHFLAHCFVKTWGGAVVDNESAYGSGSAGEIFCG